MIWIAFACMIFSSAAHAADSEEPKVIPILQNWSGDYPVVHLNRLPQGRQKSRVGYIGNTAKYARYALERPSQIVSYIAGIQKLAKTVFKTSDGLSLKASARGSSTGARYRRIV